MDGGVRLQSEFHKWFSCESSWDPGKSQKRGDVRKEKTKVARRAPCENVIEVTFLLDFP